MRRGALIAMLTLSWGSFASRLEAQATALPRPGGAAAQGPETPPRAAPQRGPGGIVAIVGDEVITRAELDRRVERRRAQLLTRLPASAVDRELAWIERDVLDSMADTKILLQLVRLEEKKTTGPYVTEADLDQEVNRQVEELKRKGERIRGPEDLYRQAREAEGLTREDYRKNLKEELAIQRFLWLKVYKSNDDFIPPQELKAYYQANREEFTTIIEMSFRFLSIKPSRDNRMDLLVDLVRKGVKEQKDFQELARQAAELQGEDGERAGILYRKSLDELKDWVKPTADVLRSLKKGEVSDAVITVSNEIRFYKLEDLKQGDPKTFEEVQELISRRIREQNHRQLLDAFLEKQRRKIRVQTFLPPLARVLREEKGPEPRVAPQ